MLGCLVDMALASWEKALTPKNEVIDFAAGVAALVELMRQLRESNRYWLK